MISAAPERRWLRYSTSALASVALHLGIIALALFLIARWVVEPMGDQTGTSRTAIVTIERRVAEIPKPKTAPRPVPAVRPPVKTVPQRHELSKIVANAPPAPPTTAPEVVPQRTAAPLSPLARDAQRFAQVAAQLSKGNDPHVIPTLDPASRNSSTKSYAFEAPGQIRGERGDGIITPVQRWHDRGRNCYYARYEYTYPDGASESGNIVWPVCYDPVADPFLADDTRRIPFPLPPPGFRVPDAADLPPYEKAVYQAFIGQPSQQ